MKILSLLFSKVKKLFAKTKKFFLLSWTLKIMVFEALIFTGLVRFAILFIPFNKLARKIGKYNDESTYEASYLEKVTIGNISWAVNVARKRTPWESKCLVQALTAQLMLKKRKISSTVYLGVAKNKEKKLKAHAWLRCGSEIITGNNEREGFTVVAKFANNPSGGDIK